MRDYFTLFELFCNHDLVALCKAMQVWLKIWAGDVLSDFAQSPNKCWRRELQQEGRLQLVKTFKRLFRKNTIESGEHLVNYLRLDVRKAMRKRLQTLFSQPLPSVATMAKRVGRGEPILKDVDPQWRVPILTGRERSKDGRWVDLPRQFYSRDPHKAERYWNFVYQVRDLVLEGAKGIEKTAVVELLKPGSNVAKAARTAKLSRETLRDRLKELGRTVAGNATEELRALFEEFHPRGFARATQPHRRPAPGSSIYGPSKPLASAKNAPRNLEKPPRLSGEWRSARPNDRRPPKGLGKSMTKVGKASAAFMRARHRT